MGVWEIFRKSLGAGEHEFVAPKTGYKEKSVEQEQREIARPVTDGKLIYYDHPNSGQNYLAVEGDEAHQVAVVEVRHSDGSLEQVYPKTGHDLDNYLFESTHGPTTFDGFIHPVGYMGDISKVEITALHRESQNA